MSAEQSRAEQTRAEQSRAEQSRVEQSGPDEVTWDHQDHQEHQDHQPVCVLMCMYVCVKEMSGFSDLIWQ